MICLTLPSLSTFSTWRMDASIQQAGGTRHFAARDRSKKSSLRLVSSTMTSTPLPLKSVDVPPIPTDDDLHLSDGMDTVEVVIY
jgi:hypothetical protein